MPSAATFSDPSRKIVTFMAFTVVFSLVGSTVRRRRSTASSVLGTGNDVKIILGGTAATVLLTLLSDLGDAGAAWAVGLAEISLLTSVLVNGAPVFSELSKQTSTTKTPNSITVVNAGPSGYGALKG